MKKTKKTAALLIASVLLLSAAGCEKQAVRNPNAKMPTDSSNNEVISGNNNVQNSGNKENTGVMGCTPDIKYDMSYAEPVFSCESGFYGSEFELELSISDKDLKIYYTVDGSTPTADSVPYEGKITVSDRSSSERILTNIKGVAPEQYTPSEKLPMGTVIRAAAIDKNGVSGPVVSNTYFVGIDRHGRFGNTPVVSLITDSGNLFDYEKGIYVLGKAHDDWKAAGNVSYESWKCQGNYSQKGKEWERPVNFELMESDGTVGFEQMLGMRIMGTATRTYTQKSFRFFAREEYGDKKIKYPLIPDAVKENDHSEQLEKYKTFLLRNGGNDCDHAKIRDPFIQTLVKDRDFATQASRAAVVFINGEYWGLYSIQEDYTDNYIQYNYDVDNKDVIIIKRGVLDEGQDGDEKLYEDLMEKIDRDLSDPELYSEVCDMLDIQNAIDYYCTLILTGNEDCIINLNNNWRLWRSRTVTSQPYQDGKWRFMLYDTEYALGLYTDGSNYTKDSLTDALNSKIFGSLIKNEEFKKQFVLTYMDMTNFIFSTENTDPVLDALKDEYGPLIVDSRKRFGPAWAQGSGNFENGVSQIRKYIKLRNEYAPEMLNKRLRLSGEIYELTVNCGEGGKVKINTVIPDYSAGSATGKYFSDYPVTLTAVCDDGYEFSGWSGLSSETSESITVTLSEASVINASFSAK